MSEKLPRKFGKYHLLAPLAQGGMGALYVAANLEKGPGELCVIKTVLPQIGDPEYQARFRDEAKVVVNLDHKNLVPVFDAGEVDGELFMAMEFVEGKDLRGVWNTCARKAVPLPIEVGVYITKELCRGLAFAHSFGEINLVHRDVSPPNMLISYAGEVKLTDFGLAASTLKTQMTAPGIIYGKVSYMSPEHARGEAIDGRSDQFCAGIILWELLCGRQLLPAQTANQQEALRKAKHPLIAPPSSRASRVPGRLDDIVLRALAVNPDDRYPNCEEMAKDLEEWLALEADDTVQLKPFVSKLFADEMVAERKERDLLVEALRRQSAGDIEESVSVRRQAQSLIIAVHPETETATALSEPVEVARLSSNKTKPLRPESKRKRTESGDLIDGRYRIVELIGEGGMGRVFLAEHVEIGKKVALKVLHPIYSLKKEVVARFRREARAASKIGHRNIVDVTDSGTTSDGSVYFVMEYLEGIELAELIERPGAIDVERALRIGEQICGALAAAHKAGIIHRDLKPANVFLVMGENTTDFVKVLDFGIAKVTDMESKTGSRLTLPGIAMGTPEYMSPEQAAAQPTDARSDIYSTGAILYEMLTGMPTYEGENFMQVLTKKATTEPKPPREIRADIPEEIAKVVMKALAREPGDRYQSMAALGYELHKSVSGRKKAVAKAVGLSLDTGPSEPLAVGLSSATPSSPAKPPTPGTGVDNAWGTPAPAASVVAAPARPPVPLTPAALGSNPVVSDWPLDSEVPDDEDYAFGSKSRWGLRLTLMLLLAGAAGVYFFLSVRFDDDQGRRLAGSEVPPPTTVAADAGPEGVVVDGGVATAVIPDAGAALAATPADASIASVSVDASTEIEQPKFVVKWKKIRRARNKYETKQLAKKAAKAIGRGKLDKARDLYARIAKGRHNKDWGYVGLSKLAIRAGDAATALELANEAFKAGGGFRARAVIAQAHALLGEHAKAIKQYRLVLKKDRRNKAARRGLAESQKALKKTSRGKKRRRRRKRGR